VNPARTPPARTANAASLSPCSSSNTTSVSRSWSACGQPAFSASPRHAQAIASTVRPAARRVDNPRVLHGAGQMLGQHLEAPVDVTGHLGQLLAQIPNREPSRP
jgi:hypothetical protein